MIFLTDEALQGFADQIAETMLFDSGFPDPGPTAIQERSNQVKARLVEFGTTARCLPLEDRSLVVVEGDFSQQQAVDLKRALFNDAGKRGVIVMLKHGEDLKVVLREEAQLQGVNVDLLFTRQG